MAYRDVFDQVIEVSENEEKTPPRRKKDSSFQGTPQSAKKRTKRPDQPGSSYLLGSPDGARMFSPSNARVPSSPVVGPTRTPRESIIEWFDKSIEGELQKRQDGQSPKLNLLNTSGTGHSSVTESAINSVDLESSMRGAMDTDMNEAVDSFLRAQTLVSFEGAIRAAEQAAANAPPECAEEAAVAGAKGYQAELTSVVRQKIPGVKPVEVIGYVGITRPKFRKRKN